MEEMSPIIFIDDDEDDHVLLKPIWQSVAPENPLLVFTNGEEALDYLRSTDQRPFLIVAEVNLQLMNGLELRRQIEQDPVLRRKAIPFIFFTHPVHQQMVEEAYQLTIQGFFEKQQNVEQMRQQLQAIVNYWKACLHPNRFPDDH
ncbi:response regulator [Fibrisoma montanum]|uniref:Response regulator n=1 Tax=Fibrisoma montanum TaxID=2305895 RepID=A0A418MAQ8_9BACT|nr:response regulator [Fibrisoma montanum]RIV23458.1 response regulator [Fibrisoma montanum]